MHVKWVHGDPEAHSMSSRVFRSAFHFATSDVWDLRLCVLEMYLIYCTLYLIHFRVSFLLCCDAFCSLLFLFVGVCWVYFCFRSVKTGSRLLSVTLPLHNSSSGSVMCANGKVNYTRPPSRAPNLLPAAIAFYLSTGEKPDSIKRVTEVTSHSFFCFSKRHIFQPRLDSGNKTFRCVVKHLVSRRSLEQLHTCMVFYWKKKVTNNAGPKFMCLSSSLFVTYFPGCISETNKRLVFSTLSAVLFFGKVKPYPFPTQLAILNVFPGPSFDGFMRTALRFQYFIVKRVHFLSYFVINSIKKLYSKTYETITTNNHWNQRTLNWNWCRTEIFERFITMHLTLEI